MATAERRRASGGGCALVVFARRPRAGRVKTRLARDLGAARAARIYRALLERTLLEAEAAPVGPRILMPAAPGDLAWFRRHYGPRGWRVRAQRPGDLGRRMALALAAAFSHGGPAVLIGSDVADFRASDLAAARAALAAGAEVVLGPALDGGYWLVGLARPTPGLFAPQAWGRGGVCAETLRRCARAGLSCVVLPPRRDVDTAGDLRPRIR